MHIQLIRSATLKLALPGGTLLIDPYLGPKGSGRSYAGRETSPLVDLPMPLSAVIAGVDGVFVSHLHSDHFDETAKQSLAPDIKIFTPQVFASQITAFGFGNVEGVSARFSFAGVDFALTDGQHGPPSVLGDMGQVFGFHCELPNGKRLYWVGDSILCPAVENALAQFKPDVIVAHGSGAMWHGQGPIVMDFSQIKALAARCPEAQILVTHLNAVDHARETRSDLARLIAAEPAGLDKVVLLREGETLAL